MNSKITPVSGKRYSPEILRKKCPREYLGVQAIVAEPEFANRGLYVMRTDLSSAFTHITRKMADAYVLPHWTGLSEEEIPIVADEYNKSFDKSNRLIIGEALSPRIYDDFMRAIDFPQKSMGKNGSRIFRYADDIIIFHNDKNRLRADFEAIKSKLENFGFVLSKNKTREYAPGEQYGFLGRTFHSTATLPTYQPFYKSLPLVQFTEESSKLGNDGILYLNCKYRSEFYPSNTLNGYGAWAAIETASGKSPSYEYDAWAGHSRIYKFYKKHIKEVNLQGNTPSEQDACLVLLALSLHNRELRGERETPLSTWLTQNGIDLSLSSDATKGSLYHKQIRTLFKEEYAMRVQNEGGKNPPMEITY